MRLADYLHTFIFTWASSLTSLPSLTVIPETFKAAQAPAESPAEAAAERAAAGPQRAPERTVSQRGGAVATGDGGGRPWRRPGHTDVTPVNQSVLPLCLLSLSLPHHPATTIDLRHCANPDRRSH